MLSIPYYNNITTKFITNLFTTTNPVVMTYLKSIPAPMAHIGSMYHHLLLLITKHHRHYYKQYEEDTLLMAQQTTLI